MKRTKILIMLTAASFGVSAAHAQQTAMLAHEVFDSGVGFRLAAALVDGVNRYAITINYVDNDQYGNEYWGNLIVYSRKFDRLVSVEWSTELDGGELNIIGPVMVDGRPHSEYMAASIALNQTALTQWAQSDQTHLSLATESGRTVNLRLNADVATMAEDAMILIAHVNRGEPFPPEIIERYPFVIE